MTALKQKILMIDDDASLAELVKEFLTNHNFDCVEAYDAQQGLTAFAEEHPDIVLLDVMLPEKNGFELCQEFRQKSNTPIIMLTARGTVADRVHGLELGADDYLAKPFEPRELLARIHAILRRQHRFEEPSAPKIIYFDGLTINLESRTAAKNEERLVLTNAEFELLLLFATHPGETLNRDHISQRLRGTEWEVTNRSVDVIMSRLRQKLGDDPKDPKFFKTIWGSGYMFIGKTTAA